MALLETEVVDTDTYGTLFLSAPDPDHHRAVQILLQILEHLLCRYRFNLFQWAIVPVRRTSSAATVVCCIPGPV